MRATIDGRLSPVPDCKITIPGAGVILMNNLPDISDSKSAVFNSESIIGRSFPLYTYSHSSDRTINMVLHFFIVERDDAIRNLNSLRYIQSAVYPRSGESQGTPYQPPPVCTIECGKLLSNGPLCALLQSYSVKFPTEVAWDEETYCPYRFDVDTNWLITYTSSGLPYQEDIVSTRIFRTTR